MNTSDKFEYVKFIPITSAEKMAKKSNTRQEKLLENQLKYLDNEERYSQNILEKSNISAKSSIGRFHVDVRKSQTYKNSNNTNQQYVQLNRGKIIDNRTDKRFRPTMMSNSSSNRLFHAENINAHNMKMLHGGHKRLVRASSDSACQVGKDTFSRKLISKSFTYGTDEDDFYPLKTFGGSACSIPDIYQDDARPRSASVEGQKCNNAESAYSVSEKKNFIRTATPALPGISLDRVTESQLKLTGRRAHLLRTSGTTLISPSEPIPVNKTMHKSSSYTDDRCSMSSNNTQRTHRPLGRSFTLPTNTGLTEIKEICAADEKDLIKEYEYLSIKKADDSRKKDERMFKKSLTRTQNINSNVIRLGDAPLDQHDYKELLQLRQTVSESELTRRLSAGRTIREQVRLLRLTKSNDV